MELNGEVWRDIPDYEDLYQVSNLGRVKSLERMVKHPKGGLKIVKEKILNTFTNNAGYPQCTLAKLGSKKSTTVHVLIAKAFLGYNNRRLGMVCDHINNIKTDNRLDNLQLISHRENNSKDRIGSSKYTGVGWAKNANKWHSYISINKKKKHLGSFCDEHKAHLTYQKALKEFKTKNK